MTRGGGGKNRNTSSHTIASEQAAYSQAAKLSSNNSIMRKRHKSDLFSTGSFIINNPKVFSVSCRFPLNAQNPWIVRNTGPWHE